MRDAAAPLLPPVLTTRLEADAARDPDAPALVTVT
jgi:hypothetical protein